MMPFEVMMPAVAGEAPTWTVRGEGVWSGARRAMMTGDGGTGTNLWRSWARFVLGSEKSRRRDLPLKVTRAFSDVQVKFVALKRERMVDEFKGMLKLAWPADRSRGMLLPRVAFL